MSFLNPILRIPDRNKPEPNNTRQLNTSLSMPPISLLTAYAKFCELIIIPENRFVEKK